MDITLSEDIDPESVSYTHLDVYKRQFISCSEDRRKSRSLHTASTEIKKMKSL